MPEITVEASALTAEAFAPFGDVIETSARLAKWINQGTSQRFDDLAQIDVLEAGGRPALSIVRALPRSLPLQVAMLERHPQSSQAFVPLEARPFLVVVAHDGPSSLATRMRAFLTSGHQGVNYRRGTWHHPLITLWVPCFFLVVDRAGAGPNCEEVRADDGVISVRLPSAGA